MGDASRNTATFAVSREHRAGPGRSGWLLRTGTRQRRGWEEGEPDTGPQRRARRVSLQGGPTLPRKILPGVDSVPTRQGLFDWRHGVPVGPPFTRIVKGIFLLLCAPIATGFSPYTTGSSVSAGARVAVYCSAYHCLSIPMCGSLSAVDHRPIRSSQAAAALRKDYRALPVRPGSSMMR